MAPDSEVLKRKRSRPSDWWAAAPSTDATTPPQRDERPPKKRGRPSMSGLRGRTMQEAPTSANRGKATGAQSGSPVGDGKVLDNGTAKKKRGRPSTAGMKPQVPNLATGEAENQTGPKKRGRPAKRAGSAEAPVEDRPAPKKRGRPSISRGEEQATTESPVIDADRSITRGRRSGTVLEVLTATSAFGKSRRGRKPKDAAANDQDEEHGKTKKRRKEAGAEMVERAEPKEQGQRIERPAQIQTQEEEEEGPLTDEPPNYQHLAEVIHRVSRQTIQAKWEALPPSCVERVSDLLHDIQRPVVQRLADERKRTQASTALEMVSRRLISKISKGLPFPPSSGNRRDDDLDFEKILDQSRDLEAQLTLALHANHLLESELSKETAQLEAEEDALAQLETNAKTEASRRKEAGRKLHSLLQVEDLGTADARLREEMGVVASRYDAPLSLEDEDLRKIVEKLNGHVDSIQGNIKQVQGISEAMVKSKAAVQASLFGHLERTQYEDVVLG